MDTCVLCLKTSSSFNSYIPINSQRWWQSDVPGIIEKHFWPVDDQRNTLGICFLCWSKLHEFHVFYQNVEEAHRGFTSISGEKKFTNCYAATEIYQTSPAQAEFSLMSNEEQQFAIEEICDEIKIENGLDEYENISCEPSSRTYEQIPPKPIYTEKRKPGRPRKKGTPLKQHKVKASTTNEKPKGKRGRPRKDSVIVTQITSMTERYTTELEPSPQCSLNSSSTPAKKRARGRPRKVQNVEESSIRKELNELPALDSDVLSAIEYTRDENQKNFNFSNINETEKIVSRKRKLLSLLKKRKPVQQHKALMRNYIATSVRCMKFFKK